MLDNVSETLVFNNFYPLGLLSVFADAFHFWDNWHANFEVVFDQSPALSRNRTMVSHRSRAIGQRRFVLGMSSYHGVF